MASSLNVAARLLAIGIAMFFGASGSFAQPSYEEGMARQRAQEQAIIDEGAYFEEGAYDEPYYGGDGYRRRPRSFVAPMPDLWTDLAGLLKGKTAVSETERIANDPVYRDLANGVWTYTSSDPTAAQGMCAATFWTQYGGVTLINWIDGPDTTFLGFFGLRVPKSQSPEQLKLSLTQSGETQTVQAFKMTFPPVPELGLVLFLVPSFDALLGSIEDRQDFKIAGDGTTFAEGDWHSGLEARDHLQACRKSLAR